MPLQAVREADVDQNFRFLEARIDSIPNVLELVEQEAPSAPDANRVRIYAEDNGGKTQLLALFNTGEPQLIAEQP